MQHLLTEKEYKDLKERNDEKIIELQSTIDGLCMRVCNNEPVKVSWRKEETPEPWGCIHSTNNNVFDYCDECPVQSECDMRKNYSK